MRLYIIPIVKGDVDVKHSVGGEIGQTYNYLSRRNTASQKSYPLITVAWKLNRACEDL